MVNTYAHPSFKINELVETAREAMLQNENHHLSRKHRFTILNALWETKRDALKWLAVFTARRVQPIYEAKWLDLMIEKASPPKTINDVDMRLIIRSVANGHLGVLENLYYVRPRTRREYAKRMIDIAEDTLNGLVIPEYAERVSEYYDEVMNLDIHREPKDAYYAWRSAYQALGTVCCYYPFELAEATKENQSRNYDEELIESDVNSADFAIYAAFASAYVFDGHLYDASLMKTFWEWWLLEVIPNS